MLGGMGRQRINNRHICYLVFTGLKKYSCLFNLLSAGTAFVNIYMHYNTGTIE